MKSAVIILVCLLSLCTVSQGFSQAEKSIQKNNDQEKADQKITTAKFIKAEVLENAGAYTFKDASGEMLHFAFDDYSNQNLPYNFFDKEGNTNAEFIGSTFKVKYISKWEVRGDSEEKIVVNKISSIKLIKKGA